jgi:cobalt/nickel transport system permease protein
MTGVHMLIGLGEGLITALVIVAIGRTRPDLLAGATAAPTGSDRPVLAFGLVVVLALLLFGVPVSSSLPDGLEHVARALGFAERAQPAAPSPMAEYRVPGLGSAVAATSAAGFVGALVVFGLACGLASLLTPRSGAGATGEA